MELLGKGHFETNHGVPLFSDVCPFSKGPLSVVAQDSISQLNDGASLSELVFDIF